MSASTQSTRQKNIVRQQQRLTFTTVAKLNETNRRGHQVYPFPPSPSSVYVHINTRPQARSMHNRNVCPPFVFLCCTSSQRLFNMETTSSQSHLHPPRSSTPVNGCTLQRNFPGERGMVTIIGDNSFPWASHSLFRSIIGTSPRCPRSVHALVLMPIPAVALPRLTPNPPQLPATAASRGQSALVFTLATPHPHPLRTRTRC